MKNLLKKFGFQRLIVVVIIAISSISMWGCGETEFRWNEERSGAKIVGFVNDSLIMVGDYRCWTEITDGVGANYNDIDGCGQERLCVYNYRVQEDGPRWCDSLSDRNSTGIFGMEVHSSRPSGQMTDSVIWGGYVNNSIRLWKIGELPHEISLNKKMDGCSVEFTVKSVKQWFDGTFIAKSDRSLSAGDDNCQYAVLDTVSKLIIYKRLDEKLEWVKKCDDVRTWGKDVVCLKRRGNELLNLLVNNERMDSIYVRNVLFWDSMTVSSASLSFYGKIFYWAYVNSIDFDKWKIKLNPNVRPLSFPSFGEFVDEKKKLISY